MANCRRSMEFAVKNFADSAYFRFFDFMANGQESFEAFNPIY